MIGSLAVALSLALRLGTLAAPPLFEAEAERLQALSRQAPVEEPAPAGETPETPAAAEPARPAPTLSPALAAQEARRQQFEAGLERERRRRSPRSLLDTAEEEDRELALELAAAFDQLEQAAGGSQNLGGGGTPLPPGPPIGTINYRTAEITIYPPTGFAEPFLMQTPVPAPPPTAPRPLLVVFHKFGSGQKDVLQNTAFLREAAQRGWFVLCPLGASKKHFASLESQINTEAVLDWFLPRFNVDRNRIYGVGFSMGGGAVTNFAARHLDPSQAMFAAIVDHSGGVALNNTYYNDPPVRPLLDFWYGNGTAGSADPWKMTRSSVIDFDPVTLVVDPNTDLARNLLHIPLQIWRASSDPIFYVPIQCDVLDTHMRNLGLVPGPTYSYTIVPYAGHSWGMLDFTATCDWLAQFSLSLPTASRTLADRDGTYFQFFVEQDAAGAFTPFTWTVLGGSNEIQFTATANLKRLTFDPADVSLNSGASLRVHLETSDGLADEVELESYPSAPSLVMRDSQATSSWTYNAAAQELVLIETDGAAHDWLVVP